MACKQHTPTHKYNPDMQIINHWTRNCLSVKVLQPKTSKFFSFYLELYKK